jgi:hypothetical protein
VHLRQLCASVGKLRPNDAKSSLSFVNALYRCGGPMDSLLGVPLEAKRLSIDLSDGQWIGMTVRDFPRMPFGSA